MRMIDADALLNKCAECQKTDPLFEGRGWASHFISDAGEPSTEWYCVEDMIENAPTIDAIPVEWLKKIQTGCVCDTVQVPMYVAIGWLVDMWRQEQGAR